MSKQKDLWKVHQHDFGGQRFADRPGGALKHRSIISNKKTDAVSARQKEEGSRVLADEFRAESASIVHHNGQQLKCVSCLHVLGGPTIYRIGRIGPLRMGVCIKTTGPNESEQIS